MAQTGYTPILIYSSSTASNAPVAANLTNSTLGSELAINITDGKLFYKDNANAIQVIGWKTTPTTAGGTGLTSYTAGDLLYYASGTTLTKLAIGTAYYMLGVNAGATAPSWQPSATSVLTTQGDLLYASAANTLARLAKNTTATRYLSNTGASNNPAWAQIDLTNGVTGVLPVANGGTNASAAGITAFNNITGYTASGATGTTSTNLVFSTSPTLTTPKATTTIGVGNATAAASGAGMTFPAVQSASSDANTLDDYAENTWTPAFVNGTFTYGFQSGFYTKIGRMVIASALITWTAKSGAGNLSITLPFTINSSNYYRGGISLGNCRGLILNAGFAIVGTLDQSASATDFYFNISNATAQQMTLTDVASSGAIQFTAVYMV
jgi:hypothetical protein